MDYNNLNPSQEVNENGLVYELGSLFACYQQVQDIRKAQGKQYPLAHLLVLMTLAKLGGRTDPAG
jgi:hypothetical protein